MSVLHESSYYSMYMSGSLDERYYAWCSNRNDACLSTYICNFAFAPKQNVYVIAYEIEKG